MVVGSTLGFLRHYQKAAAGWIDRLQQWDLSEDAANSYLLQAYEQGLVGARLLPLAIQQWRNPRYEEYRPRTGWSLWNCLTDVLRERQARQPGQAALSTIRLQRLLAPPSLTA
jgi:hypothetical protein